jgi:hypothetical protein
LDRSSEIWSSEMDRDDDDDDSELPARRVRDLRLLDILDLVIYIELLVASY